MELEAKRQIFLQKVCDLAEISNWQESILEQVCIEMQLTADYYKIWFPRGVIDILNKLEQDYDVQMLQVLDSYAQPAGITDKVGLALQVRICQVSPSKLLAQSMSRYYLRPRAVAEGLEFAWRSVDLIWQYAGDDSLDYNYYTKRALLHGIYVASQLCYNRDNSTESNQTRRFIQSSLRQIVQVSKCIKHTSKILRQIPFLRIFI